MSHIWERNIKEWYDKSETAHLKYLDLATTDSVSNKNLAHNLAVVYDRICLSSKVSIKDSKLILESLSSLENRVRKIEKELKSLTLLVKENRPLTAEEIQDLVAKISKQPKIIEEQALKLSTELQEQVNQIKVLLHQVKSTIG